MTERLLDLPVKIFADGADLKGIAELSRQPYIHNLSLIVISTIIAIEPYAGGTISRFWARLPGRHVAIVPSLRIDDVR